MRIGIDIDDTLTDVKDELIEAGEKYARSLGKDIKVDKSFEDKNNNGNKWQEMFQFNYKELKYFLKDIQESITNKAKPRENVAEVINKLKTALLNAIYTKTKIITYHQNDLIWGMGIEANKDEMEDFKLRLVDGQKGEIKHFTDSWKCLRKGTCEGILIGGNLSTLVKLLNTEYCPNFKDCILFLEEFAEESPLDEVDSKINILKQQGVFNQIKGLWIGYYEKDTEKVKYEDVVMNNVKEYKFPILKCNDFGHNCSNVVIPIGAKARLTADECKVELL